MVHGHWFFCQFIAFNSVLSLSRSVLELLLLSETKDCVPVCFPFLLSSLLPGICFIKQCTVTAGSCSSPRFPGSSSTLGLGFLLLRETASSFQWASTFHSSSLGPCCLSVGCFPAILCLTFLSLLFLPLRNYFPFLRLSCICFLSSCLPEQPLICWSPNQLVYLGMYPEILSPRPTGP